MKKIVYTFLIFVLIAQPIFAFETDQYNLPKEPLADIGDEVSQYVAENIQEIIAKVNAKITHSQNCLDKKSSKNCSSDEAEKAQLEKLRSDKIIAKEIYKRLGFGLVAKTKIGTWLDKHKFIKQPARYKTSYKNSIFFTTPINYFTISPTINLYGYQVGTDKIAHIFQQGYTYHQKFNHAKEKGLSDAEAIKKAINWGRMSEKTFYGTLVSGVFSNGDLAANYAGIKFYQNLTQSIKIGQEIKEPLLIVENGLWKINGNITERLIKPFVSNHLNEVYNPSIFINAFGFYSTVKKIIKKNACQDWLKTYSNLTPNDFDLMSDKLNMWYGEDYGYQPSERFITISITCFDNLKN